MNGDIPTQHPVRLTPFLHATCLTTHLSSAPHEAVAYLMGYNFLPIPLAPAARKRAIRVQIGCSVGLDVQNYCKCIHSCQPI